MNLKNKIELWQLKQRQGQPLEVKERLTENRIRAWYEQNDGEVYVSFSGGKDSTVLLHLVRKFYPDVSAVFVDTGLEYPEVKRFVRAVENVTWLRPKIPFYEVIKKYGYPVISKEVSQQIYEFRTAKSEKTKRTRWYGANNKYKSGKIPEKWKPLTISNLFKIGAQCCDVMKKRPIKKYEKETDLHSFIGVMAKDSALRKQSCLRHGCNMENGKASRPMMFWTDADVWGYIKKYNLKYSKIYDMGVLNTGCMFCMFGVHLEKGKNRFQRMNTTHPNQYNFCINTLGCGKVLDAIGVSY